MTEQLHPMVPPNILLNNWESDWVAERKEIDYLLTEAYQAGADAELEACCEAIKNRMWFAQPTFRLEELRAARRPKPPSLKEQALVELAEWENVMDIAPDNPIRLALEALPDKC
ncbi:hypothetical protein SWVG_00042 [Synechococcus phage S-RIP1]|uniref:Uncharacterized protein n=1 Tax=Synechococcus phage S-RIP1 TaxID=754041 RepID=M4NNQ1_9CAUD|nr:hypothetical protein SWVG_00042 [Synechococcus phage S-RIP1]AGG91281.1 hypothetical protein SWVG_00042 [Synechococcus phage S-RIP1]